MLSYFVGGHLEGVVPINVASSLFSLRPYDLGFIFWDFWVWLSKGLEILILIILSFSTLPNKT